MRSGKAVVPGVPGGAVMAVATVLAIGLTASLASIQQTPPQNAPAAQQPPVFRAGVNYVRVDAVVTDEDGAPVLDLTADDFEIKESGTLQKIDTFKLVRVDGSVPSLDGAATSITSDAVEQSEAARDDVRLFAIFLDDYHVTRDWGHAAREQVARFVQQELGPNDMVGVMYPLTPLGAIRMTRNHDAVVRDILRFEGRKDDFTPKNVFEEAYVYKFPAMVPAVRRDVSFSALRGLIMHLGGLKDGRQSLLILSEGYRANQTDAMDAQMAQLVFMGKLDDMAQLANRNNTSLYTVNPAVLPPERQGIPSNLMESLSILAERSGGRAIFDQARTSAEARDRGTVLLGPAGSNLGAAALPISRLATAMQQIAVDARSYYLIGYNSTLTRPDGKYHKIDVNVKPGKPGNRRRVQVHHRQGYWAYRPEERLARTIKPAPASVVKAAVDALALPRGRPVRTWLGFARGEGELTRVTFSWEPAIDASVSQARDATRAAQVVMLATGAGDDIYYSGRVPERPADGARGASVSFDVRPGPLQLRIRIEDSRSALIDTEVRDLVAPDLFAPQTLLGTPQVFRAASLPELQRIKTSEQVGQAGQFPPVATREFRRTDRLLVRVPVYGIAGVTPSLTARLINRSEALVAELPTEMGVNALSQIEVPIINLGAGEYAVRIVATGPSGSAEELLAFRVIN